MLYHSLISSHINYCNLVWGFSTKQNLDKIHKLQKRAVRLVTHSLYISPSNPLFVKLHILPIRQLVSLEVACFMFKINHNLLPDITKHYFTYNNSYHNYNTRNAGNFHTPFHRTSTTQSSIFYHGTLLWNNLPTSLKNCTNFSQFKRQYKLFLFHSIDK